MGVILPVGGHRNIVIPVRRVKRSVGGEPSRNATLACVLCCMMQHYASNLSYCVALCNTIPGHSVALCNTSLSRCLLPIYIMSQFGRIAANASNLGPVDWPRGALALGGSARVLESQRPGARALGGGVWAPGRRAPNRAAPGHTAPNGRFPRFPLGRGYMSARFVADRPGRVGGKLAYNVASWAR